MRQAERDLEEAKYSKQGRYYELSCFLSQQSAEKAVKGLLQFHGMERKGNSVLHLIDNPPDNIRQCASYLDKQYTPSRYPDVYDEGSPFEYYTEKEADECISCAEKILSWVKREIS
ncbi:HEPN domain-containing protein [Sulfuracidifex tepidarius]|uniref:HEPN domain-containing protein n=1 Tax=Sulfuracidifex tepidarius TaxID=1294262 RepID=A0A510DZE2_9CREN|nr:HEPN domain-containing protein [Sulfuracidifex tepidarius]BBG22855.1 hypothetical protein IC006_0139 [Sulfuracidifex tepidarius]BBG25616.1 hypothetical protein IC007_0121 [Sulfuracidifex tepidarius]